MIEVRITGYDKEVDRGNPLGLHITYDADTDSPITSRTIWLDDGATALEVLYPVKKGTDGRYERGTNIKPTITGSFHFHIQLGNAAGEFGEAMSDMPVIVTESGSEPGPGEDMDDQFDRVCEVRKRLFPELYQPGHPEANRDGWLRIDRVAVNQSDHRVGLERGAEWAKTVAWEIGGEAGVAHAKPGSSNHGGACSLTPDGIVTDIVCRSDGAHWDFQQDGGGAGYPQWNALPEEIEEDGKIINLWEPIKARFVPAFDPKTP